MQTTLKVGQRSSTRSVSYYRRCLLQTCSGGNFRCRRGLWVELDAARVRILQHNQTTTDKIPFHHKSLNCMSKFVKRKKTTN